jgi:WhiB family redox-sensing transcriptional regulator
MSEQRADLTALVVNSEQLSWQERALCAQTDPEAFFPEKGGLSERERRRLKRRSA